MIRKDGFGNDMEVNEEYVAEYKIVLGMQAKIQDLSLMADHMRWVDNVAECNNKDLAIHLSELAERIEHDITDLQEAVDDFVTRTKG